MREFARLEKENQNHAGLNKRLPLDKRWYGILGILIGMSCSALMRSLLVTSMPQIAKEFGSNEYYSWVFGAYLLASTVTIPFFGKLSDLTSRRIIYAAGMMVFMLGSFIAASAQSMIILVASRTLMGIGAGAVVPSALAAIGDMFGQKELPKLFGFVGITQVVSNLIGPPLGGLITDGLSWRWGFILLQPLVILSTLLVTVGVVPSTNINKLTSFAISENGFWRRIDWMGSILVSVGLLTMVVGVQSLGDGRKVFAFSMICIAAIILFFLWVIERKHCDPVIPLEKLAIPRLRAITLSTFLFGVFSNTAVVFIPLLLQVCGSSPSQTGFLLVPMLFSAGLAAAVAGKVHPKRLTLALQMVWISTGASFLAMAILGIIGGKYFVSAFAVPAGFGMGFILPVLLSGAQGSSDDFDRGRVSGVIHLSRDLGGAMGVSLLGCWISGSIPIELGLRWIFVSLVIISVSGLLIGMLECMAQKEEQACEMESGTVQT